MQQERPTKKQRELLSFIDGFIKGNGYGPSYREVMRALDYKSVSTVAAHIDGLIARGWLIKRDNSARTLEVVNPTHGEPSSESAGTVANETERTILAKIDELKADHDANHKDIEVLERALRVLGYHKETETV